MRNITSYFIQPFNWYKVGRAEIYRFYEDHTGRLTKAVEEGEPFNALVLPTNDCLRYLEQSYGETAATYADQQALTIGVDNIIDEFKSKVISSEPLVLVKFDKKSMVYQQFYPFGRTEYVKLSKGNAAALMTQFMRAAEKNVAVLGQTLFDELEDLHTRYLKAREDQTKMKESTSKQRGSWETCLRNMENQVFINIHTIAIANINNPLVVRRYFTQSILRPNKHTVVEESQAYILKVTKNSIATADMSFSVDDTLLFYNSGTVSLFYYGAVSANAPKPEEAIEIQSGEEVEVTAASLGAPTNKYLLFANNDATDGEVEISILA